MKKDTYVLLSNDKINDNDTYKMVLRGDTSAINKPGEFIEISLPNVYLPRPFSISYYDEESIHIVYKVVGEGTEFMSSMKTNDTLEVLTGLGNGFDLDVPSASPLLIGGGVGVAPLYNLACNILARGIVPQIIMGFKNKKDRILVEEFIELGIPILVTLEEEYGNLVTDALKKFEGMYDYFYACGPTSMMNAIEEIIKTNGEYSLEARMGCGYGQCKGCSIETLDGMRTVCHDGPVFKREKLKGGVLCK